jgi:ABC-2 type transport system permease protein
MAQNPTRARPIAPRNQSFITNWLDLEAIYSIWLRDIKKFWRERSRLWGGISRPILWLIILGSGLRGAINPSALNGAANYQQYIFPGVIGLTLIFSALQSAISIIWDREFGFLKEVLVAPVPRTSIIIGKVLGGASQATMQGTITLMFAPLIGLWLPISTIIVCILTMFIVACALTALGVMIASNMTSFEGFGTLSNFVVMPMYFLSGAIYPTASAPDWLKPLIIVNPLSYGVDALRQVIVGIGQFPLVFDLGFLALFGVVMVVLAVRLFKNE